MRLFKRDDPTFQFNTLDKIKRWRAYVASYVAIEPTEDVDMAHVYHPYLKKRLAKVEEASGDDRFENVQIEDKIMVTVNPANYTLVFTNSTPFGSGGVQYTVQPDEIRAGTDAMPEAGNEFKKLNDDRREKAQEKLMMNTSWMKEESRQFVDDKKANFRKFIEEGLTRKEGEDPVDFEEWSANLQAR